MMFTYYVVLNGVFGHLNQFGILMTISKKNSAEINFSINKVKFSVLMPNKK
jgi:hypothetical protein